MGPGTGESQPIAGSHIGSRTAHQEHSSTQVETALTVCGNESPCRVKSSRDRDFRSLACVYEQELVERCSSQPSFRASCGSTSSADGHWKVRGDALRHRYYGTYASDMYLGNSLPNISALSRSASPIPSVYSASPVMQNRHRFNYASPSLRPESRAGSGYVPGALEFGYYLP